MKTRRTMKRVLSLLLCVLMFATLLPSFTFADLSAPALVGVTADGNGLLVEWSAVSGADSYRVYRKTGSSKWSTLGETSGTTYKDTSAAAGTTYTYTVRCLVSGVVSSPYDTIGVSGAWTKATAGWLATPKLVSATASKTSITVKWEEVSDAASYRVYRKTAKTGWTAIANVPSGTDNYEDTSAAPGTEYIYTVRCLNSSSEVCSDYNTTGVKAKINAAEAAKLDTPELIGASAEGSGLRVSWNAVSGAEGYRVYRKSGSGSWAKVVDVNSSTTSYLDNTAKSGTKYTYTVRCLNSSGAVCSDYNTTGVSGSWSASNTGSLTAPVLDKVEAKVDGVEFSWNAVSGADGYRIYRKTGNGGWITLAEVSSSETSYLDTTAKNNTEYTYTVRCLSSGSVSSGYDSTGKKIRFFDTPELVSAACTEDGITVKWGAVSGAPKYLLYRGLSPTEYKRLATVSGTSYTDTAADPGTEYYYTVRVFSADEKTFLSDFDHAGVSATFIGKVEVSSLRNVVDGVEIKWETITGATKYVIERKSGSGEFKVIGDDTGDFFIDTTAVSNTGYVYRVYAVDGSDKVFGTFDSEGMSIIYYATPVLVEAVQQGSGVLVTWEEVEGLQYFNVYRKVNSGNFIALAKGVTGTSYLDTTVVSGVDATYTVRGVSADGEVLSDYDHTGILCHAPTFYAAPVLDAAVSSVDGILFTWQEVDGVSKYRVFRKDNTKTSWEDIADVAGTEYLDLDVASGGTVKDGGTYTYTVACLDSSDQLASEYNTTGVSATYYMVPVMVSASNEVGGVKVLWEAAAGVGSYAVYRKTGSESWKQIASGVSGTSYIDSTAKSAGHYAYAVASMVGGKIVSEHEVPGVDTTFYAAPTLASAANTETGVKVKWNAVDGVDSYRVYKKVNNKGSWIAVGDVSGDTELVDNGVVSNNTYTYTVRCLEGSTVVSDYNKTGISVVYLSAPELVSAVGGTKSVKVTWKAVDGATSYLVYRKTAADSNWSYVATVNGGGVTTYTNKNLNAQYTYYYTIMARNADGVTSSYNSTGVSATTK